MLVAVVQTCKQTVVVLYIVRTRHNDCNVIVMACSKLLVIIMVKIIPPRRY